MRLLRYHVPRNYDIDDPDQLFGLLKIFFNITT
jgi:hypothetical protein